MAKIIKTDCKNRGATEYKTVSKNLLVVCLIIKHT